MTRILCICAVILSLSSLGLRAQTTAWIQIEAHPTLGLVEDAARGYTTEFPDVAAFALNGGWYAIALGPYRRDDAEALLSRLRSGNSVPRDAFVVDGDRFTQQVFPFGVNALNAAPLSLGSLENTDDQATTNIIESTPTTTVVIVEEQEETPAQARSSERELDAQQRRDLQVALQWEGFYLGAIDGDFGAGTRRSMSDYQAAYGFEQTGILTTRQRSRLLEDYNAVIASLGLRVVQDAEAGISVQMPMGLVAFDRYEPPFVHYDAINDSGAKVLLISQAGDRGTLFGLYEIMQTLEIVPLKGARSKGSDSFELTGQNDRIHSYTYARYSNGQIKGFTLIYEPNDEKLMSKVTVLMRESLQSTGDAVLDPLAGDPTGAQSPDLLAGLDIRRPSLSRSGFYVDAGGAVLTTTEVLQNCSRITVDQDSVYSLAAENTEIGLALLKPQSPLTPLGFAKIDRGVPRLRAELAISGFSYEGALGASTVTYGALADLKDLKGNTALSRLEIDALPGDTGGPVLASSGHVIGMLLPNAESGRALPANVRFAAKSESIIDLMTSAKVATTLDTAEASIAPEDLLLLANDMTVLVSCWE